MGVCVCVGVGGCVWVCVGVLSRYVSQVIEIMIILSGMCDTPKIKKCI